MQVQQRQIIEVPFNLSQGIMNHPALILSVNDIIQLEEAFTAVMITSENYDDEYSFPITNDMLQSGTLSKPYCEIRVHLVSYFKTSEVITNKHRNTLVKVADFN